MSQDRELEDFLEGGSPLSEAYADLPEVKLPDHLDAAILAEAHRAVRARPGGKSHRSWVVPLSMAASLFVVVVLGVEFRHLLPVFTQPSPAPATPRATVSQTPGPEAADRLKVESNLATRANETPAQRAESSRQQDRFQHFATGKQQAEPRPPAAQITSEPSLALPVEAPMPKAKMSMRAAPSLREAPAPAEPAVPATDNAAKGKALNPPASMAPPKEERRRAMLQQAPAGRAAGDELPSAPPAASMSPMPEEDHELAPEAAPAKERVQAEAVQPQSKKESESEIVLPPKAWLKRIARLKREGKRQEARKELADFRKHYPKYRIPRSLQEGL